MFITIIPKLLELMVCAEVVVQRWCRCLDWKVVVKDDEEEVGEHERWELGAR